MAKSPTIKITLSYHSFNIENRQKDPHTWKVSTKGVQLGTRICFFFVMYKGHVYGMISFSNYILKCIYETFSIALTSVSSRTSLIFYCLEVNGDLKEAVLAEALFSLPLQLLSEQYFSPPLVKCAVTQTSPTRRNCLRS